MAQSYTSYLGDGTTSSFVVPFPFISQSDIHVYIDNVEDSTFTWLNGNTIQLSSPPSNGSHVVIERRTPLDPLFNFQDGSILKQKDLNDALKQALFVSVESNDTALDAISLDIGSKTFYDAQGRVLKNLPLTPQDPSEATSKDYVDNTSQSWYNTAVQDTLTYKNDAANSASSAANSASNAANSATDAANSATDAANSASSAANSAASIDQNRFIFDLANDSNGTPTRLPRLLTANTDFNTIQSSGNYNFDCTSSPNRPFTNASWCFLEVFRHVNLNAGSEYVVQVYHDMNYGSVPRMAIRRNIAGTWSNWEEVANASSFTNSLTTNGYQKLQNGLIIQWGETSLISSNQEEIVTLPIAMPTAILSGQCTPKVSAGTGGNQAAAILIDAGATTQIHCVNANTSSTSFQIIWMVIGY